MKALHTQDDLFASAATSISIDAAFSTAKRTALDEHSWVEVVPGWMSGSHLLFERLATEPSWQQRNRRMFDQTFREPRLTTNYETLVDAPHEMLAEACRALWRHYGVDYDGLWMNNYRDGQDSTGWHRDTFESRSAATIVPVLTLGATRRFLLKPYVGGRSIAFKPVSGDLIVMGGYCQRDWVHSVPKEPGITEARISVNFQSSTQSGKSKSPRAE